MNTRALTLQLHHYYPTASVNSLQVFQTTPPPQRK